MAWCVEAAPQSRYPGQPQSTTHYGVPQEIYDSDAEGVVIAEHSQTAPRKPPTRVTLDRLRAPGNSQRDRGTSQSWFCHVPFCAEGNFRPENFEVVDGPPASASKRGKDRTMRGKNGYGASTGQPTHSAEYPDFNLDFRTPHQRPRPLFGGDHVVRGPGAAFGSRKPRDDDFCTGMDMRNCTVAQDICGDLEDDEQRRKSEIRVARTRGM
jgi:hypothetical protein